MIVKHIDSEPIMPNPWNLEARKLYDGPHGDVLHLTLPPGRRMLRHISSADLLLYVLEGLPTIEYDQEQQTHPVGAYLHLPSGAAVCVRNDHHSTTRLLIIKIPKTDIPPVFLE